MYSSKRYLKPELWQSTYAAAFSDANVITIEPRTPTEPRLEISINEHLPYGNISISYIYSRPSRNGSSPDPLHNPDRPIAGATDIPEKFYEELEAFVKDRNLKQPFLDTFDADRIRSERLLH